MLGVGVVVYNYIFAIGVVVVGREWGAELRWGATVEIESLRTARPMGEHLRTFSQ